MIIYRYVFGKAENIIADSGLPTKMLPYIDISKQRYIKSLKIRGYDTNSQEDSN